MPFATSGARGGGEKDPLDVEGGEPAQAGRDGAVAQATEALKQVLLAMRITLTADASKVKAV